MAFYILPIMEIFLYSNKSFICFIFFYYLSLIVCTSEPIEKKFITPGTLWCVLHPWEKATRSKNTRVLIANSAQVPPK